MKKRNLLITTIGSRSTLTCQSWLEKKRNYDTFFIYYDKTGSERFRNLSDYFISLPGYKYPSIQKVLYDNRTLISDYDYFFMPDDDVKISTSSINKLFNFARNKKISICQPSLFPRNFTWHITVHNRETKYRYVNMVEIMCPLFSKDALCKCLPSFGESQSGFGLEIAWVKLLILTELQLAIYDRVIATHQRPHDPRNGPLYVLLKNQKIDPYKELAQMKLKYNGKLDFSETKLVYKNKVLIKRWIKGLFAIAPLI